MPDRRICDTVHRQHRAVTAALRINLVLHKGAVSWLMELKWLETAYFFFFFFLGCFKHRSPLRTHSTPVWVDTKQQNGGRGREEQDYSIFTPNSYELPWDYTSLPWWWSWGQSTVWIHVDYFAETVCHLVVCQPPTNRNLKNSKELEVIMVKKNTYFPICLNL